MGERIGTVGACWRYPVKSLQGHRTDEVAVGTDGVAGDRRWGLVTEDGHVLSAKRTGRLLEATGRDGRIDLPDGRAVAIDAPDADEVLSAWLDRPVRLVERTPEVQVSYQMTFDPPDDDAEVYDIPAPPGTFLDLAPLHLVTTATLEGCARARPDVDWDVRRFRPNVVLEVDGEVFVEQDWVGRQLRLGDEVVAAVAGPTVRCAMPLRAQPAHGGDPALDRQPDLYRALTELNTATPNHLGVYATVATPGTVHTGDPVELLPAEP